MKTGENIIELKMNQEDHQKKGEWFLTGHNKS